MPTAQTILDRKGKDVATVDRNSTVLDAAILMNQRKIGAVVVRDGERAVGIFTERDILNRVVAEKRSPDATKVGDVMTSPMACCRRDTQIKECRSVMASKRIRHLPVVEDGRACGMISSRDILADKQAIRVPNTIGSGVVFDRPAGLRANQEERLPTPFLLGVGLACGC